MTPKTIDQGLDALVAILVAVVTEDDANLFGLGVEAGRIVERFGLTPEHVQLATLEADALLGLTRPEEA